MEAHPRLSDDPEVIVFNLKQRYTGVSATVNALVPLQMKQWRLGYCGTTQSNGVVGMGWREAISVSRRPPPGRPFRIWHVRRDPEMMLGLWAADVNTSRMGKRSTSRAHKPSMCMVQFHVG